MAKETVLITGVSGHVGFRVLIAALTAGYNVRGVVRRAEQIVTIRAANTVQPYIEALQMVLVPDMQKDDAFDAVLRDVAYVIHVASPLAQQTENAEKHIIEPAVKGTVNILSSAHKTPTVKRVVVTSSVAVLTDLKKGSNDKVLTERDIVTRPSPPYGSYMEAYMNAKVLAYYATIDWVKENKPTFDIINMFPSFVIGPNELCNNVKDIVGGSNGILLSPLLGNKNETIPFVFTTVHVDDVATAHVKALDLASKGFQDFVLAVPIQKGTWNDALEITRRNFPNLAQKHMPLDGTQLSGDLFLDSSKATIELGIKFKSFEEQVKDLVGYYLSLAEK